MARRKRKSARTLRGTPEVHQSTGKRLAQLANEYARAAESDAHAGRCGAAILTIRRMGRAEGAAQTHYEQIRQTLPTTTLSVTKNATELVHRVCTLKT